MGEWMHGRCVVRPSEFELYDGGCRHVRASVAAGATGVVAVPLTVPPDELQSREDVDAPQTVIDRGQVVVDAHDRVADHLVTGVSVSVDVRSGGWSSGPIVTRLVTQAPELRYLSVGGTVDARRGLDASSPARSDRNWSSLEVSVREWRTRYTAGVSCSLAWGNERPLPAVRRVMR